MNCQDNSRLKVPLPEMCKTTDIGCVPMTSGKPDCPPERDQIPLAYDINSQTLWIFSCESRQWVAMSKFQLAELQEVSLDNIRNICELLKIPVYYNPGGGTVQGSMPLADFGKELLKCQDMTPKAAVLGNGTVAFTIEGLESLDPLYVRYVNLETSGEGTQSNPLVIKAQDPLTQWPKRTEQDVDDAVQPLLAADLDGEMVRVPYPKKPCEYTKLTQAQVESASEPLVIGCVDGQNVKIPYPPQPENYDVVSEAQVEGSNNKWLVAVINGKRVLIPFPKGDCENERITTTNVTGATNADVLMCLDGNEVRFPVSELSAYIAKDSICNLPELGINEALNASSITIGVCMDGAMRQISLGDLLSGGKKIQCIPVVMTQPSGAPDDGFPFRMDCDGNLWLWDCNANDWLRVTNADNAPGGDVPAYSTIQGNVNNPCTDVIVRGHYLNKNDPTSGYNQTKMSMSDVAGVLTGCGLADQASVNNTINNRLSTYITDNRIITEENILKYIKNSFLETQKNWWILSSGGYGRHCPLQNVKFNNDHFFAYSIHKQRVIYGQADIVLPDGATMTDMNDGEFTVVNPFDQPGIVQTRVFIHITPREFRPNTYTINGICGVTDNKNLTDIQVFAGEDYSSAVPSAVHAVLSSSSITNSRVMYFSRNAEGAIGGTGGAGELTSGGFAISGLPQQFPIDANASLKLYMRAIISAYAVTYPSYDTSITPITEIPATRPFRLVSFGVSYSVFPRG